MALLRGYEMADALRDQAAFETFMGLLQARGLALAARTQASGAGAGLPCCLAEASAAIVQLAAETERANMDRRQAVIAGLALVRQ